MSGVAASRSRTLASNGVNDVTVAGVRTYFGGPSEATAFATVFLDTPSRDAILAFGTPSAASLLISAQSSKVITLQSLKSAHFLSAVTAQSWSAVENQDRRTRRADHPDARTFHPSHGKSSRASRINRLPDTQAAILTSCQRQMALESPEGAARQGRRQAKGPGEYESPGPSRVDRRKVTSPVGQPLTKITASPVTPAGSSVTLRFPPPRTNPVAGNRSSGSSSESSTLPLAGRRKTICIPPLHGTQALVRNYFRVVR